MLTFKVESKILKVYSDTKYRVEWNHSIFSQDLVPGSFIYPFEIPTFENIEIFGTDFMMNSAFTKKKWNAEVLWLNGTWLRGFLIMQRKGFYKYSVGFVFQSFPEGWGDEKLSTALPLIVIPENSSLEEFLYKAASYTQGQTFTDYGETFTTDFQSPLLWADSGDEFQLRNLKNPNGDMLWGNSLEDWDAFFNKKLIAPSVYLKSAIQFELAGWNIGGSWLNDPFMSEILLMNSKPEYVQRIEKKMTIVGTWVYSATNADGKKVCTISVVNLIDPHGLFIIDEGEPAYNAPEIGYYAVDYRMQNCSNQRLWANFYNPNEFDFYYNTGVKIYAEVDITNLLIGKPMRFFCVLDAGDPVPSGQTFVLSVYLENEALLKRTKNELDLSLLVPSDLTKGDLLRNTLPALGCLLFVDGLNKEIEFAKVEDISKGKVLDLSPFFVNYYSESTTRKQRVYSYDSVAEIQTSASVLKSDFEIPEDTGIKILEPASDSYYESAFEDGVMFYKRLSSAFDNSVVDTEFVEKESVSFAVKPCENAYISDFFPDFQSNAEYAITEIVNYLGKLYASNISTNTDVPGDSVNWIFICDDAIIPIVADSTLQIAHFKGIKDYSRVSATSTRFDKNNDAFAAFSLKMSGNDGLFENYLKQIDFYKNSEVTIIDLDSNIDIELIRELFTPSTSGHENYRRFRINEIVFIPSQFSCILQSDGISEAQIKGVFA